MPVLLTLSLNAPSPDHAGVLVGTVETPDGAHHTFSGVMELVALLERLLQLAEPPRGPETP